MAAAKAIPDCLVSSSVCWQVAPQHHLAYPARQRQHRTNSRAHEGVTHEEETPGCNLTPADCTQTARMDPKTVESLKKHTLKEDDYLDSETNSGLMVTPAVS